MKRFFMSGPRLKDRGDSKLVIVGPIGFNGFNATQQSISMWVVAKTLRTTPIEDHRKVVREGVMWSHARFYSGMPCFVAGSAPVRVGSLGSATILLVGLLVGCFSAPSFARDYRVKFVADLQPADKAAEVELTIRQKKGALRQLSFAAPAKKFSNFKGDGKIRHDKGRLTWQVPRKGGSLMYTAFVENARGDAFDARVTDDWALLRFNDMLPEVTTKKLRNSTSSLTLELSGPKNWAFETPYGRLDSEQRKVKTPKTLFPAPRGWLLGGDLGVRRESVGGRTVTVAAPLGSRYPRVPTLAFLHWTLPELIRVFPTFPDKLLMVSGDESMWLGALSGPASVYLHPRRPLISENATSTVLHELVHVATRWSGAEGDDWIVEGIAEYYSLKVLFNSGGISRDRFDDAITTQRDWVSSERGKLADPSKSADTSRALILFHDLDEELSEVTEGGLDEVVAYLLATSEDQGLRRISRDDLRSAVKKVLGKRSVVLREALTKAPPQE